MFKRCPKCHFEWQQRTDFLEEPGLQVIGYQVNFDALAAGIFLFNHDCKGTLAIPAAEFLDLHHGPIFKERATDSPHCPGYCLHEDELDPCPVRCECVYVREILQVIKQWPKKVIA